MRIKQSILISFVIALLLMVVGTVAAQAPAEEWNKIFDSPGTNNIFYSVQNTTDGGYILAGQAGFVYNEDLDHTSVLLIKTDENGIEQWNRTFGSGMSTSAYSVQQTSDGGYILAGDFGPTYDEKDAWLIKTNETGVEQWNKTYGDDSVNVYDGAQSVQQIEGGYILAGSTNSFGAGKADGWLIKTNETGVEQWNKTFGGIESDYLESVQQTDDGGYILAGHTYSGTDYGDNDVWLIKTNQNGDEQWNMTFGDAGSYDYAESVQQTSDGGYILAGSTMLSGTYYWDAWLIKTNETGVEQWKMTFGGTNNDKFYSVQQTSDGGYTVAGETEHHAWLLKTNVSGYEEWNKIFDGGDTSRANSVQQVADGYILAGDRARGDDTDGWLIKIAGTAIAAEAPAEEWNNTFDIGLHDYAWSVQQTSPDGGYILAGVSGSDNFDALLIKTDYNGNEMWNKTLDNAYWDYAESVQQTSDGGYILAGTTLSDQGLDAWLIKTNETGVEQWNKTFGGTGTDQASSVQQTSEGGYILAGYTGVVDTGVKDVWLIKTNETGVEEWNNTFGGINDDMALSVQQTSDGGYILAGSKSTLAEDSDAWLIKTDRNGDLEWDMTFAGATSESEEEARSVQQTSDGGYILAGYTGPKYLPEAWLIKTNEAGVEEWNKTFGTGYDGAYSAQQTSDGGYILAGYTTANSEESSGWLIKTDPAGIEEWNIKLNDGGATSVRQTLDGGYILAGITGSEDSSDALLVKIAGTGQAVTTHYVGDGGYATIQAAVDAAADGDTIIVYPGTYTEDVLVNKELIIESYSQNPEDTIVQAASYSAFWVVANNTTISGFKTVSYYNGIIVESCNNTILTNNIMEGADESPVSSGIVVQGSCNNTILTNNSVENDVVGIIVESCNNTILTDNMAKWNYKQGILVQSCNNTVLINNVAENNEDAGIVLYLSDNCILTDNTVNSNYYGIALGFVNNSILTSNIVTNNRESGILLYMSNSNKLTSNTASDNYLGGGIKLVFSSNNELTSNTAANNYAGGIQLDSSSNNELTDNTVTNNNQGIYMDSSSDNTLTSNMVSGNNYCGIWLVGNNNTVSSNNVSDNVFYGFHMSGNSNLIYNNRFNNSTLDFTMDADSAGLNTLNSTEMLTYMYNGNKYTSYIGNNYSEYEGVDYNGDGIGDTPHWEDSYPLMFWPVEPIEKPPVTEIEPVADAGGPYSAVEGSEIIFDASKSYDPDGVYLEYRWDFESNGTWIAWSTEPAATHTWSDNWTGTVTLEVNDGELNNTSMANVTVTNADPVVDAGDDQTINEGDTATFSGSFNDAGTADTHTIAWEFGDGSTADTLDTSHTYADSGTYTVNLTVTDDDGGVGTDSLIVTVNIVNAAPAASAGGPYEAVEGSAITFDASASSDPDAGDALQYRWDFESNGTWTAWSAESTATHTWNDDWTGIATVEVSDGELNNTSTADVTVTNADPIVNAGDDQTVNEGDVVEFSGNFTDPGTNDTHAIAWEFGDGSTASDTLIPNHTYADSGSYTVNLTVTDDNGGVGTDSLTVTVNIVNSAPVANAGGPYTAAEGSEITFDASASSDLDANDTLQYRWDFESDGVWDTGLSTAPTAVNTWDDDWIGTATVEVSDGELNNTSTADVTVTNADPVVDAGDDQTINEGDTATFSGNFTDPGTNDTHTIAWDFGDGSTADTLEASHTYADSGTYTVNLTVTDDDGGVGTDSLTVTVNTVNSAPVANAGGPYEAVEGSAITFDASASSDPDAGDTLQYRWDFESDGTWDTELSADPTASHTWNDDWTGTVTVEVNDGELNNTSTADVTVTNADPIVNAGDDQTVNEEDVVEFSGNFTDPGTNDTHTIAWDFGDGSTADTLDTSHTYADSGTYIVNLTVTDDDGGVGNDSLTVTVNTVNSAPVASVGGPYEAVEGSAITFDASASSDPDGDSLQYRWDFESDGTWDTEFSTDPEAGHTWTDDWTGTVTLEVNDGELNNTSTAAVIVTNADPVLGVIVTPTGSFRANTLVSVSGTFSDPGILDTHTAVWNWGDGTTDAGTVNENNGAGTVTGEHSYNTAGTYWVTLNVTDDDGGSANVTSQQYVVVYDPSAGYVTGAGWIQSPEGAYALAPSFAGKGTLKISAKYAKGAALPSMTTEFSIKSKTVNMNFKSTSYDWIVINGAYAKYTGSGTFNGAGNHGYMVSVVDGDIAGDYIDNFRIKIWNKSTGKVVYDNEMGVSEDMQPTTILGSGSIVIHPVN